MTVAVRKPLQTSDVVPKGDSLSVFFRSLALMGRSGVRLEQALRLLGEGGEDPRMKEVSQGIALAVRSGAPVSGGMTLFPRAFTKMQLKLVQVGEKTGKLDQVLDRLGVYEEQRRAAVMKVRSALVYPSFLFALSLLLLVLVPPYLFGGLFQMIEESGVDPPWLTRVVMGLSNLTRSWWFWPLLLGALGAAAYGAGRLWRRPEVRLQAARAALRVPVLGRTTRVVATHRFAQALAFQLEVGIAPMQALELAAPASANPILEEEVEQVLRGLRTGLTLDESMSRSQFLPRTLVQMVKVGEESGKLPAMLDHVARLYDAELEHSLEVLTAMLEPLMMLVMGLLVGLMIVATLLPMTTLVQSL